MTITFIVYYAAKEKRRQDSPVLSTRLECVTLPLNLVMARCQNL
ncbi:MAG TPA: hypothetical protein VN828_23670 [Acidobacteriaceae bacterium]|nr:hypothetical protein [Acidobacteriaceae bacterium]